LLGEPRELPTGVQADIDNTVHPVLGEETEEAFR
jgi:hypothetical protein